MGFSGGGSNVLLPHTHDGTVSQDGGPLNFNNITQSQSAAGQVFFSDGAHLQQLSIGAANDELRVNAGATAPEWYTPGPPAAGTWTIISDQTLGAAGDLDSGTFGSFSVLALYFNGAINTAGWSCSFKLNNTAVGSGLYNYTNTQSQAATTVYSNSATDAFNWDFVGAGGSTDQQSAFVTIFNTPTARKLVTWNTVQSRGGAVPYRNFGAGFYNNTATEIDQVEMCSENGTTGATRQFASGSRFVLLGLV